MGTWRKSETFGEAVRHAAAGVKAAVQHERNLRRQLLVAALVLVAAWWLGVSAGSMMVLLMISGVILSLEVVNSAVELLLDSLHPQYDDRLGAVKDMMAGAVLVMSAVAVVVGLGVLGPPLIALVGAWLY